jgi:hypothetical protein
MQRKSAIYYSSQPQDAALREFNAALSQLAGANAEKAFGAPGQSRLKRLLAFHVFDLW